MKVKKKIVYLGLSADVLHHGHINIIQKAKKYGELTVGLQPTSHFREEENSSIDLGTKIQNTTQYKWSLQSHTST